MLQKKILCHEAGQALVELTLIFPMLLTLALGAVEIANIIYTYQVMHRVTAQGANIASRMTTLSAIPSSCTPLGTDLAPYCAVMNKIIDSGCPTISQGPQNVVTCPPSNDSKWRVIFTEIGPDPSIPAGTPPPYVVRKQVVMGAGEIISAKRICEGCGLSNFICDSAGCSTPTLPDIDTITKGNNLFAFEVFFDYSPITVLGNFVGTNFTGIFYERSVF